MNILFLNDSYSKEGGTERYIETVTKALREKGHQVLSVVGESKEKPPADVTVIPNLKDKPLLQLIADKKIDVVNFQTVEHFGLYKKIPKVAAVVRMLHDTASVCKYHFKSDEICTRKLSLSHCLNSSLNEGSMTKNPLLVMEKVTARQAILKEMAKWPVLLANSEYTKQSYVTELVSSDRIRVIPMFPTVVPDGNSGTRLDNIVLFSGRVFREKGLEFLIRSFSHVRSQAELWVVGEGWDTERNKEIANELALGEWIRFWGFLETAELKKVYSKAAIGVVPSMWGEPFGLTGIEMMAFGMPVVGFDSGAVKEWLHSNENGFLVGRGDTYGLAEKINILLLDKEKREQLGKHAMQFIESNYTIKLHLTALEEAYTRAISHFKKP
jgi:glycosyltransferase involved in cell wall biosynthesis